MPKRRWWTRSPAGEERSGALRAPTDPGDYPEASKATTILALGILGVWPFVVLGPFAWWMGRNELAAIDAGRRPPEKRAKANAGRTLGMISTLLYTVILVAAAWLADFELFPSTDEEIRLPGYLTGDGANATLPADWRPDDAASELMDAVAVSPNPSSGNFIAISRIPLSEAGAHGATAETFVAGTSWRLERLDDVGGRVTSGPTPVTVAGIQGLELRMGLTGERTGTAFEARRVALFGAEASYLLDLQFDAEGRDETLEAWEIMLSTLRLRDISAPSMAPEFDQLLLTDFTKGPEPFVTGTHEVSGMTVTDGSYRMERRTAGRTTSVAGFSVPTQAVTIVADIAGASPDAAFGVACVNDHETGYFGYGAVVLGVGELNVGGLGIVKMSDDEDPVLLMAADDPIPSPSESINQITITCTVDPYGAAKIAVGLNGEERARVAHSDESISFFTAAELIVIAETDRGATLDIQRVDAHAPRPSDPTHP